MSVRLDSAVIVMNVKVQSGILASRLLNDVGGIHGTFGFVS